MWYKGNSGTTYEVNLNETYPDGAYRFSVNSFSDSMIALPEKKESPVAKISFTYVSSPDNEWLNKEVKKELGVDTTMSFGEGIKKEVSSYFAGYRDQLPKEGDTSIPLSVFNYERQQTVFISHNSNGFVVTEAFYYEYSGGAHGNHGSAFYCYDVVNKKQLRLSDIITTDSTVLQPILEKYFREQYHIKSSLQEVLFDNHISANDNFYFNEKGIGFVYNPYEIASYAQGQINVFIPFSALQKYINPAFRARVRL